MQTGFVSYVFPILQATEQYNLELVFVVLTQHLCTFGSRLVVLSMDSRVKLRYMQNIKLQKKCWLTFELNIKLEVNLIFGRT